MKNITRNTAAVLVLTLFTGLAVFTAIQLGDRLFGTSEASAQAATTQAAVQSSSDQNADDYYGDGTSGSGNGYGQSDPYGYDQGSSGSSQGYSDPYGYGDSSGSSGSSGQTTMTCPATGCSASTCHATQ
jgi:hypothetical protein